MKKIVISIAIWMGLIALSATAAQASHSNSDHGLFCTCSSPADTAVYAGVRKVSGSRNYAYTVHISATAVGSAGAFRINFRDGDSMGFTVPADSTVSTSHTLGGVPKVDDIVKITAEGGVISMMVSVQTENGAQDPFNETLDAGGVADHSNFVVTAPSEPGSTSAAAIF
jgi:hypothetical protein